VSSKKVKRKAKHVDEWGWAYAHIPKKQQVSASARSSADASSVVA